MYVHPAFRVDRAQASALVRERAFGTLVISDSSGRPLAVHLPFLAHDTEDGGLQVELHLAKANPLHELVTADGRPALLICQGPNAYISPDWYGTADQVPTWTYVAVHLAGRLRLMPESEGLAHVNRLSAAFEARLLPKKPWTADKLDPQRRAAMMGAIVTMDFLVPPDGVQAQKKLIQHKGLAEHDGAIAGLRARGDTASIAIAELMEHVRADKLLRT